MYSKTLSVVRTTVDFKEEEKRQRRLNFKEARQNRFDITNDVEFKLRNHAEKVERSYETILRKYQNDAIFRNTLAKDPSRQCTSQKAQLELIKQFGDDIIQNFQPTNTNEKIYLIDGIVTNETKNNIKNLDLQFSSWEKRFYCTLKHTKIDGGGQGNQRNEVINFLLNAKEINDGDDYFLAIVDGDYYDNKWKDILRKRYSTNNIKILSVNELYEFLVSLLPETQKKMYEFC